MVQKRTQKGKQLQRTKQERKSHEDQIPDEGLEEVDDSENFPNFAKFCNFHKEGYSFLSKDAAWRVGRPIGPDRAAYDQGCLSRESYEAHVPYPEAIRTTLCDVKKTKKNLTHKLVRELMATRNIRHGGPLSSSQTGRMFDRLFPLLSGIC